MKLLIAGDYCPRGRYLEIIEKESADESIFGEKIIDQFRSSDFAIVNLEAPVKSRDSHAINKSGGNLGTTESAIKVLKKLGVSVVTLANNHFRDYGHRSILHTLDILNKLNIMYVGGGKTLSEASEILYIGDDSCRIAVINCCEREYSIAGTCSSGSNPISAIDQYYKIKEAKSKANYVVVITHSGIEHYQLPTLEMKKCYHFFIDAGADAVVNHHQHCYSGYEVYNGKPIFYGLGNFCFDHATKRNDKWNYGYLVELCFNASKIDFDIIPYEQSNATATVNSLINRVSFDHKINELNSIIVDDKTLEQNYILYSKSNEHFYDPAFYTHNNALFKILRRLGIYKGGMSDNQIKYLYDVVNCDSHRNRFLQYLYNKIS